MTQEQLQQIVDNLERLRTDYMSYTDPRYKTEYQNALLNCADELLLSARQHIELLKLCDAKWDFMDGTNMTGPEVKCAVSKILEEK